MVVKSYEQVMQEEAAARAEAQAKREARLAEIDAFKQMEQQRKAEQDARLKENYATYKRAMATREGLANGTINVADLLATVPTLESIEQARLEQEASDAAEAERQRIAALTPRQKWLSTLSFAEQDHIRRWEQINRVPYPVAGID